MKPQSEELEKNPIFDFRFFRFVLIGVSVCSDGKPREATAGSHGKPQREATGSHRKPREATAGSHGKPQREATGSHGSDTAAKVWPTEAN